MSLEVLGKIGLSQGEVRVFSSLLESGPSPMSRIHERTGIERRNIYDILNKLIGRGLVAYVSENGKRIFRASHPEKIIGCIDEKMDELERTEREIRVSLPSMVEKFNSKRPAIDAEIYRGAEGVKAVWEDMLECREVRWIGSGRYVPEMMPHFFAGWNKRRIKLKVRWFNLLRHDMRGKAKAMPLEHMKFLPEEFSGNPSVIGIYGSKVADFVFGDELFAFVIESRAIAENYVRYHKYLWNKVAMA